MDKHTKHIIVFFVAMLLASLITFSVLYLLPLVTSGTDPPKYSEMLSIKKVGEQSNRRNIIRLNCCRNRD